MQPEAKLTTPIIAQAPTTATTPSSELTTATEHSESVKIIYTISDRRPTLGLLQNG